MEFKIRPYKLENIWYFDDKSLDIYQEPFVLGASEMIDKWIKRARIGADKNNPTITFSTNPIEHLFILNCVEKCEDIEISALKDIFKEDIKNHIGNIKTNTEIFTSGWYEDTEKDKCWLCPVQLKYFNKVADKIYINIE